MRSNEGNADLKVISPPDKPMDLVALDLFEYDGTNYLTSMDMNTD